MMGWFMARRKMKRKTQRRAKTTNLLGLAQSIVIGNAVTQGLFKTNMYEFVTGRIDGNPSNITSGNVFYSDQITLPELLGAGLGKMSGEEGGPMGTAGYGGVVPFGSGGQGVNFTDQVMKNVRAGGVQMATTLEVAPIAFKVFSKLARKPRAEFNKLARTVGLPVTM